MAIQIRQILYVSQMTRVYSSEMCEEILLSARAHNTRNDITGFLACLPNGTNIQIIEGASDTIGEAFERICKDARHSHISKILDFDCEARTFPEWSMGFRLLDDARAAMLPDFVKISRGQIPKELQNEEKVIRVLRSIFAANTALD